MPARGRDRAKDRKFSSALQHILSMVASDGPVGEAWSVRGKRSLSPGRLPGRFAGRIGDPVPGRESTRAASASAAATSTFTASCDDDHERAVTIAKGQVRFRGQRAGLDLPLQARPQTGKTLPIAIQRPCKARQA
jgi:hypothetical protein